MKALLSLIYIYIYIYSGKVLLNGYSDVLLKNIDYVGNASYFIAICASMHQSVLSSMVLVFRGVFAFCVRL